MFKPDHPTSPEVQTLRVELFVAEKRVADIREQLAAKGDAAFVAQLDRERKGETEICGF